MTGKRIKQLRKAQGLTQSELGEKLGVIKQTVSSWENDISAPSGESLISMSKLFAVSVDYLLGNTDQRLRDEDLEWRYAHAQSRLGQILSKYRNKENISINEFANKLCITSQLVMDLEIGIYVPSMNLIKRISHVTDYDIDYLIGSIDSTYIPTDESLQLGGSAVPICIVESDNSCFRSRFEELCMSHDILQNNCLEKLSLSPQVFLDIQYNRMPTLAEILRIAYAFNVSTDYLIGRVDSPLFLLSDLEAELVLNYRDGINCNYFSDQELKIINTFQQLNPDNQDIIIGEAKKVLKEQRYAESNASENCQGKSLA